MTTTKEFIEQLVDIQYVESSNCYGHYPFQLFVETNEEKFEMNALMLGGDVLACYNRVRHYVKIGSKKIFLSVDFPAGGDITNDFVAVFSILEGVVVSLAIPYDANVGTIYKQVLFSEQMKFIESQFKKIVFDN
jgi:hypothetical protein